MISSKISQYLVIILLFFAISDIVSSSEVIHQDQINKFDVEVVIDGLGIPWGMAFLSADKLIFSQRNGKIGLINLIQNKLVWLKNTPSVYHNGQAGLLDVAVPDDYEQTGWIYFTYSKSFANKSATVLARAQLENNSLQNWLDIIPPQIV